MQALAVEAFKLILCLLHNPVTNQVLVASRLDDGSQAVNPLDDEFYITLLVSALHIVREAAESSRCVCMRLTRLMLAYYLSLCLVCVPGLSECLSSYLLILSVCLSVCLLQARCPVETLGAM